MIVLGMYEGVSLLSKIIKWETRSDISHVSIMQLPDSVYNSRDELVKYSRLKRALDTCPVWEAWATAGVVKRTGIHEGHTPGTKIHLMRLEDGLTCDEAAVVAFLDKAVASGIKYDWWGLVRFGLRINRQNQNRMFCSELAHLAMVAGRMPLLRRVEAHFVAPADLYRSPLLTSLFTARTKNALEGPGTRRSPETGVGAEKAGSKTCNGLQSQKTPVPLGFRQAARYREMIPGSSTLSADSSTGGNARFAETRETGAMQHGKGLVRV